MSLLLGLTKKLISFKTTEDEPENITDAFMYIQSFFANDNHLFESKILKLKKTCALYVSPCGVTRPDVLLVGHIDVVKADKKMYVSKVVGDKLFGRGAFDMKGPIAAMICAMKDHVHVNPHASVGMLITSDEERGGFDGMGTLITNTRFRPRIAIVPDGGSDFVCAQGGKGAGKITIIAKGSSAHSARPWEGKNAIMVATKLLVALEKKYPGAREQFTDQTTFPPVAISSSQSEANVIPDEVVITCNIRITHDFDFVEFKKYIEKHFTASVTIEEYAKPYDAHLENKVAGIFLGVIKKYTGAPVKKMIYPSTCDARFFAERGIPVVVTRPSGGGAHGSEEWISLSGLELYKKILTHYLKLVA